MHRLAMLEPTGDGVLVLFFPDNPVIETYARSRWELSGITSSQSILYADDNASNRRLAPSMLNRVVLGSHDFTYLYGSSL